jgi:hypothetical protein
MFKQRTIECNNCNLRYKISYRFINDCIFKKCPNCGNPAFTENEIIIISKIN